MREILTVLLTALFRALLPALWETVEDRARPKAEDAAAQDALRTRLRDRIRRTWGAAGALIILLAILPVGGCGARTVYVRDGEPVRLRETIRAAPVWVLGADGKPVAGVMDLPEGWFCLPPPDPED